MKESVPEPQPHLYAVVDHTGKLATGSPSRRWAFKTLIPAAQRAHADRQSQPLGRPAMTRLSRTAAGTALLGPATT